MSQKLEGKIAEGIIMRADQAFDVQRFIDARGLSRAQVLLLVLCFLVVAVDGFDTIAIGSIAALPRPNHRRDDPGV